jgi:3-oxoadipate enol-lactonase
VDSGGVLLHARHDAPAVTGSAEGRSLVLVHSLGTDGRIWDGVVARLAHRRHLRVDLRGHGLSDAPAGDYEITALADDVLAVLDAFEVRRAVLIGISVGAQVALRVALARPQAVAGIVALDTAARIGDVDAWNARIAAVRAGGLEAIADATVARWFGRDTLAREPHTVRGYRNLLCRTSPVGYVGTCAALRDEDLTPHLRDVHAPALVLCGDEDSATPPALARALAAALPFARFRELRGAGHLPCLDRASEVADAIEGFVRGLD